VTNGLFTAPLNFGANVITGQALWLEIGVRPAASQGAYTTLTPRQPLTAAPAALFAMAPWITSGSTLYYSGGNVAIGAHTSSTPLYVQGGSILNQGAITGLQSAGTTGGAGVFGTSALNNGNGVIGLANGPSAYGVWGHTDSGRGVYGLSASGQGVYGLSSS